MRIFNGTNYVGKRIRYTKRGGREGWEGYVVEQKEGPEGGGGTVEVEFDNGIQQIYSLEAIVGRDKSNGYSWVGYLQLLDETPEQPVLYYVQGAKGGRQVPAASHDEAHSIAQQKARESKSGQPYQVLRVVTEYARAEPPIQRKDFS